MSWINNVWQSLRCGIAVYTCAKFDKDPVKCVEEAKCKIPQSWILRPEHFQDKFENTLKIKQ